MIGLILQDNMENAAQDAASKFANLWKGISTAKSSFLSNVSSPPLLHTHAPVNGEGDNQVADNNLPYSSSVPAAVAGTSLAAATASSVSPSFCSRGAASTTSRIAPTFSSSPDATLLRHKDSSSSRGGGVGGGSTAGGFGGLFSPGGVPDDANYNQRYSTTSGGVPNAPTTTCISPLLTPNNHNNLLNSAPSTMTRGAATLGNGAVMTSSPRCHRSRVDCANGSDVTATLTSSNETHRKSSSSGNSGGDWYKSTAVDQQSSSSNSQKQQLTNFSASHNNNSLPRNCSSPATVATVDNSPVFGSGSN